MESFVHTVVIAFGWMLALLSLLLGLERMIRIIMANYLISSILLGVWNFVELIVQRLLIGDSAERRVDGLQQRIGRFLVAWKPTLLLTIYFVLLLVLVTKSHIWIWKIKNEWIRFILTMIFLPCTIISIAFSIALAIFWNQVINLTDLQELALYVWAYPALYNFVMLTPLRIILPWLVTIIVAAFMLRKDDTVVKKEFVLDFDDDEESKE
jgi:hypothetical protein